MAKGFIKFKRRRLYDKRTRSVFWDALRDKKYPLAWRCYQEAEAHGNASEAMAAAMKQHGFLR